MTPFGGGSTSISLFRFFLFNGTHLVMKFKLLLLLLLLEVDLVLDLIKSNLFLESKLAYSSISKLESFEKSSTDFKSGLMT